MQGRLRKWSVLSLAILLGIQTLFLTVPTELTIASPTADTTAPVISTFSPADDSVTADGQVEIAVTFTESESGLNQGSLSLTINDIPIDNADVSSSGNTLSYSPISPYDDGIYEVQVSIADIIGNRSETTAWSFTISSAPVINAVTATGGGLVSGYINISNTGATISGALPANDAGIQTVEVYLGGLSFTSPARSLILPGITEFFITLNSAQFSELTATSATKTLTARRIGFSGNLSELSASFSIIVDRIQPLAPVITLTDPVNSLNQTTAVLTSHAEPGTSLEFRISDEGGYGINGGASSNGNGDVNLSSLNLSLLSDGVLAVSGKSVSAGGNVSDTVMISATKDTILPTLAQVSLASNNSNPSFAKIGDTVTLSLTVSEAITAPAITIAGHLVSPLGSGSDYQASYILTESDQSGALPFTISGFTDTAGNPGADVTLTSDQSAVNFDNTRPEITAADLITKDSSPALGGTLDDPLASVNVTVNNSSYQATNNGGGTWTLPAGTISSLADGVYQVTAIATNQIGNMGTATANLTVDASDPVLSEVTAVTNHAQDMTPDYTFHSSEAGNLTYGGSCTSPTTSALAGDNTITFNTLVPGTYSDCTLQVTDVVGNQSTILPISTFTIDLETPVVTGDATAPVTTATVSPSSPDGSNGWYRSAPKVTLASSDGEGSGVANIYYHFGSATDSIYSGELTLSEGIHTLYYHAQDVAGNTESEQSMELKVDTIAPSMISASAVKEDINFDSEDDDFTNSKQIRIIWTAPTETGSGINHYLLRVKKSSASGSDVAGLVDVNIGLALEYTLTPSQAGLLVESKYFFAVKAVDNAGNIASSYRNSDGITIDITPPAATSSSPTGSTTELRPVVQATLTDSGSGVKASSVVMRINGVAVKSAFNSTTGVVSFTPSADLRPRTYYVAIDAKDNADNRTTRYSFNFMVN